MGHLASLEPLDESKWLGFEEKLMGNSSIIAEDQDPIFPYLDLHRCLAQLAESSGSWSSTRIPLSLESEMAMQFLTFHTVVVESKSYEETFIQASLDLLVGHPEGRGCLRASHDLPYGGLKGHGGGLRVTLDLP